MSLKAASALSTWQASSCSDAPRMSADVVVIGAGIVGASCAYALASRGLTIHLVERNAPARGTSGACEGNLVLWDRPTAPDLRLARWSFDRWVELADLLLAETGIDIEFDRKGSLMLAQDEAAAQAAQEKCAWLAEQGVAFEWLDQVALHEAEPDLAPDIPQAAYFPLDAQIEPRLATAGLVSAARRHGAVAHMHEPVTALTVGPEAGHMTVSTPRHAIEAPWVVVAAGIGSSSVLAGLVDLPITARKGQVAVVTGGGVNIRHKVMEAGYAHSVSSDNAALQVATVVESTRSGSILLGSSRVVTGPDDLSVDIDVLNRIVSRAIYFYPGLARMRVIRSYAGLRPMSPDHTPIVGPLPAQPQVVVATGHEGGGVMMAAATGELVALHILGKAAPVSYEPYLPARLFAPVAPTAVKA